MTQDKLTVSTDLLAAMAKWAYRNGDRPNISAVIAQDGELIATDGHRMVRAPLPASQPKMRLSIGRAYILAAAAAQSAMIPFEDLDAECERVIHIYQQSTQPGWIILDLGDIRMSVSAGPIDKFPDVDKSMPKISASTPPLGYVFNPAYLVAMAEIQEVLSRDGGNRGVRLAAWGEAEDRGTPTQAALFEGHGGVRYVIMPMRDSIGTES